MKRNHFFVWMCAVVLAAGSLLTTGEAVRASCNPGRANDGAYYWAGANRTVVTGVRGVESKILEYSPYVAPGSDVYAWTFLAKPTDSHAYWAQIGPKVHATSTRNTFIQWTDASGHWYEQDFAPGPLGSSPNFATIYDWQNAKFLFEQDNVVLAQKPAAWTPSVVIVQGETHTRASQMMGGTSHHLTMRSTYYTKGSGWIALDAGASTTDNTIFGASKVSSTAYDIWDKACT